MDVILCFMSQTVDSKAAKYEKKIIVKFRQNLKQYRVLKMVSFLFAFSMCTVHD